MIQFTVRAEIKAQHVVNDKVHAVVTVETASDASGIVTTDTAVAPFDVGQIFNISLGAGPAVDAITVGRKYRVTIEEVAE